MTGEHATGRDATEGMEHGTYRPYTDSDQVSFLGVHPVDELASKKVSDGVEDREQTGDGSIIAVGPVKLWTDKILPRERENLSVHIVDGGCQEKQPHKDPPGRVIFKIAFFVVLSVVI